MICEAMMPLWVGLGFGGGLFLLFAGIALLVWVGSRIDATPETKAAFPAIWKTDTVPANKKGSPDA